MNGGTATGDQKLQFTRKLVDSLGWYDNVTNFRYQPTVAGWYYFVVQAYAAGGTSGTPEAKIFKNSALEIAGPFINGLNAAYVSQTSGLVFLNGSTDYVEGFVELPTGVTVYNGTASLTFMCGWRVS